MLKWIKRHRKQIYAFLVGFCVIGLFITSISASFYYGEFSNPNDVVPMFPYCTDYTPYQEFYLEYYSDEYYDTYESVCDFKVMHATMNNGVLKSEIIPVVYNAGYIEGEGDGYMEIRTQITYSDSGQANIYNYYDASQEQFLADVVFSGAFYEDTQIACDNFFFAPYPIDDIDPTIADTRIFQIRILENRYVSEPTANELRISGYFSFVGNSHRYYFEYDRFGEIGGYYNIDYRDIVVNGLLNADVDDPNMYSTNVPIYIEELNVRDPWGFYWSDSDLHMQFITRLKSVDEAEMFSGNQYATIEGTKIYLAEFDTNMFDWLVDSISAFIDTPFFGFISFGSIFVMILSYAIVKVVIETFKG